MQTHLLMFHLHKAKKFVRQLFQMQCFPVRNIKVLLSGLFIQIRSALHPVQITDHRCQRCTQIVSHTCHQIIFGTFRFPFPLHQILYMAFHLVHIPGNFSEFVLILYGNLLI